MIKKNSIQMIQLESRGQKFFFGRDNILFKTVNMPKKQYFKNICFKFKLKQPFKKRKLFLSFFSIYN